MTKFILLSLLISPLSAFSYGGLTALENHMLDAHVNGEEISTMQASELLGDWKGTCYSRDMGRLVTETEGYDDSVQPIGPGQSDPGQGGPGQGKPGDGKSPLPTPAKCVVTEKSNPDYVLDLVNEAVAFNDYSGLCLTDIKRGDAKTSAGEIELNFDQLDSFKGGSVGSKINELNLIVNINAFTLFDLLREINDNAFPRDPFVQYNKNLTIAAFPIVQLNTFTDYKVSFKKKGEFLYTIGSFYELATMCKLRKVK